MCSGRPRRSSPRRPTPRRRRRWRSRARRRRTSCAASAARSSRSRRASCCANCCGREPRLVVFAAGGRQRHPALPTSTPLCATAHEMQCTVVPACGQLGTQPGGTKYLRQGRLSSSCGPRRGVLWCGRAEERSQHVCHQHACVTPGAASCTPYAPAGLHMCCPQCAAPGARCVALPFPHL